MDRVFNFNTGEMTIKWIGLPGGVIRPQGSATLDDGSAKTDPKLDVTNSQKWTKNFKEVYGDQTKIYPEDRTHAQWDVPSRREMLQLSHPFIWSNESNYCGINYIPPVGSVVVVGFRKQEKPVVLGYMNYHYRICKPVPNPGEIVVKGYGNNYLHCRWSDKIDLQATAKKGEIDLDCNDGNEIKNEEDCTLWLRLNANDQTLTISASKNFSDHPYKAPYCLIKVTPKDITMITDVEDNISKYYQDSVSINMDTTTINMTASELINMDAPKITQN